MDKNLEEINRLIGHLFRRRKILEFYEKRGNEPKDLYDSSRINYQEILDKLNGLDFDALDWMDSNEGKVAYLGYCVDDDQSDQAYDHCGRCLNYLALNNNPKDKYDLVYLCALYGSDFFDRIICKDFKDSGLDCLERISKLCINRCFDCKNAQVIESDDVTQSKDTCLLKKSRISLECPDFEAKD